MAQRTLTPPPSSAAPARPTTVQKYFPGLLLCVGAVLIAMTVNAFLPGVSPLIVAIVAVQGTYSRQNTIREYAFAAPKPMEASRVTKLSIP